MCGIVGIYLKTKKFEKNLGKMLSGMLNNMESRGPDSAGFAIYKDEGKKVYIAGHKGLAGSALVRRLKNTNSEILKVDSCELDLTNQKEVEKWFKTNKPDVVYLAAATAGGIHANYERPAEFIYNNLAIQNNVINSAYENNVEKLCFLGSSCIYPRLAQQPMQESSLLTGPLDKHNIWYAIAKIVRNKLLDA